VFSTVKDTGQSESPLYGLVTFYFILDTILIIQEIICNKCDVSKTILALVTWFLPLGNLGVCRGFCQYSCDPAVSCRSTSDQVLYQILCQQIKSTW